MKKKKNEIKLFCEFVIPPMLIWASIVVIPLIYGIYLTFTNWNGLSPNYDLVGFSNYAAIFTDKTFLSSLWKTFAKNTSSWRTRWWMPQRTAPSAMPLRSTRLKKR